MNPEVAKYLLMIHLAGPCIPGVTSDITSNHFTSLTSTQNNNRIAEESNLQAIIQGSLFNKVVNKFETDIVLYSHLVSGNYNEARRFFYKTIEMLIPLTPNNIIFSLTTSDSLHFRIFRNNQEINLEVFYSKYEENDNIEAVVNIYENELVIKKSFGLLDDIFNYILYDKNTSVSNKEVDYAIS